MRPMLLFSQLIFATLFAMQAHALTTEELASNPCVRSLIADGMREVAGVDLENLLKSFRAIQVVERSDLSIGSCGNRLGMLNLPGKIYTAPNHPFRASPRVQNAWKLHEAMGATHQFDENYGLSIGLTWLGTRTREERAWLTQAVLKGVTDPNQPTAGCRNQSSLIQLAGGGSTGVGGGGDPIAIDLKLRMLDEAWKLSSSWPIHERQALFNRILLLPLEIEYPPSMASDPSNVSAQFAAAARQPVIDDRTPEGALLLKVRVEATLNDTLRDLAVIQSVARVLTDPFSSTTLPPARR